MTQTFQKFIHLLLIVSLIVQQGLGAVCDSHLFADELNAKIKSNLIVERLWDHQTVFNNPANGGREPAGLDAFLNSPQTIDQYLRFEIGLSTRMMECSTWGGRSSIMDALACLQQHNLVVWIKRPDGKLEQRHSAHFSSAWPTFHLLNTNYNKIPGGALNHYNRLREYSSSTGDHRSNYVRAKGGHVHEDLPDEKSGYSFNIESVAFEDLKRVSEDLFGGFSPNPEKGSMQDEMDESGYGSETMDDYFDLGEDESTNKGKSKNKEKEKYKGSDKGKGKEKVRSPLSADDEKFLKTQIKFAKDDLKESLKKAYEENGVRVGDDKISEQTAGLDKYIQDYCTKFYESARSEGMSPQEAWKSTAKIMANHFQTMSGLYTNEAINQWQRRKNGYVEKTAVPLVFAAAAASPEFCAAVGLFFMGISAKFANDNTHKDCNIEALNDFKNKIDEDLRASRNKKQDSGSVSSAGKQENQSKGGGGQPGNNDEDPNNGAKAGLGAATAAGAGKKLNDELKKNSKKTPQNLKWDSWKNYEKVVINNREYAKIGDRLYTRHAIDRMQPSSLGNPAGQTQAGRNLPPNFVEKIIRKGELRTEFTEGVKRDIYRSGDFEVITEQFGKVIITIKRIN